MTAYFRFNQILSKDIQQLFDNNVYVLSDLYRNPDILDNIDSTNILILTIDHWGDDEFLLTPDYVNSESQLEQIKKICSKYTEKKFYITTCCPFVSDLFISNNNVKIIHWADDFLMNPRNNYYQLSPITEKIFNQPWHWTCLNNNLRMHRSICSLFILGEDIKNGLLRFDPTLILQHESWQSLRSYLKINKYDYLHSVASKIYPILEKGFSRVKSSDGFDSSKYIHHTLPGTQLGGETAFDNFDIKLRLFFSHSVIDIINETVFISKTGIITEKYLNSVYGYNFPIMITMPGVVNHLRLLGFDLFDDIIDHGYDSITDHYKRLMTAITANRKILEDRQLAIDSWNQCSDRFKKNFQLVESMYKNKEKIAREAIFKQFN